MFYRKKNVARWGKKSTNWSKTLTGSSGSGLSRFGVSIIDVICRKADMAYNLAFFKIKGCLRVY